MTAVLDRAPSFTSTTPGLADDATPPVPDGAEAMSRPWRLGIIGIGLAIGLVARLFIANGLGSLRDDTLVFAATATSALAAIGLLLLASERDRFGRSLLLLTLLTAGSLAVVQWISPHFASGTLEWLDQSQLALTGLGAANGLLLAGIIALALARRHPTLTVVAALVSGVLTLAVNTVMLRSEWPAILALALAFGAMLIAWDRAPRYETRFEPADVAPRISRALLGLASLGLCGAAIQLWISRGDDVGRPLPAVVVAGVLVLLAFLSLIGIRREIQKRTTTLSEWTSWMREIRTRDFRSDFDDLATNEAGALVGDVTAEPPRKLSFPDLRGVDGLDSVAAAPRTRTDPDYGAIRVDQPSAFEELWNEQVPADPTLPITGETPAVAPPAAQMPTPAPVIAAPSVPAPQAAPAVETPAAAATSASSLPDGEPTRSRERPSGRRRNRPSFNASDLDWFVPDDAEAPGLPTISLGGPDAPAPAAVPSAEAPPGVAPAPSPDRAPLTAPAPSLGETPRVAVSQPSGPHPVGAFSTALDTDEVPVVSPGPTTTDSDAVPGFGGATPMVTTTELGEWIAASADRPARLLAAVETMSLPSYDGLDEATRSATVRANAQALAGLSPSPTLVAHIDGPYLIVGWDNVVPNRYGDINRAILSILAEPAATAPDAASVVGLTGTLALVRPAADAELDTVIDDAIVGLIRARELAVVPRRS